MKSNVQKLRSSTKGQTGVSQEKAADSRRWPNSLRILRRARGLTLEQLAELSDVSVSYLSRLEAGLRRLNADTIDKLTHALGCEAAELMQSPPNVTGQFSPSGHPGAGGLPPLSGLAPSGGGYPARSNSQQSSARDLPVYGQARMLGEKDQDRTEVQKIDFKKPVEWLYRPADLAGVDAAFALYISDESMAPKFTTGDVVLTHPYRPPVEGAYVAVVNNNNEVVVRQFLSWTAHTVIVRKFADDKGAAVLDQQNTFAGEKEEYKLSELRGIYRIIFTVEGH